MIGQAERLYELNGLVRKDQKEKSGSRIIALTSGKGGTGKSFLSSSIAFSLADSDLKVLLVDLDINLANLGTMFNVRSKKSIYNYFTYSRSLQDVIYNYSENLDLILGESGKLNHPELTEDKVNTLLHDLKNVSPKYDLIIIDTASGINSGTLQVLLKSDEVILVTSPEPTCVMDAYVIFKMLINYGGNNTQSVIVNKIFDISEGKNTFKNLEMATKHFLKNDIKYLGEISFSQDVIKSIQEQSLFVKAESNTIISDQIRQICNKLRIPAIG